MENTTQQPRQLSKQSARRLAAAAKKIRDAKLKGERATVNALRDILLSAGKTNPAYGLVDEIAGEVLARLPALYLDADEGWSGR